MNLYKILFTHSGPKSAEQGIKTYLLAENEEQVYEFIDKKYNYESWKDMEEDKDCEDYDIYDEDYNIIGTETFKEKIIRIKGEMNDEDYDYCDSYYGITLFGWELVKEKITTDFSEMLKLGIMHILVGDNEI